jgi:cytochrome c
MQPFEDHVSHARRIALALLFITASAAGASAAEDSKFAAQGRVIVDRLCASCHAIGRTDRSPHVAAPPFRNLDRQTDLDTLAARLREGLMTGHQDMPMFRFSREDAWSAAAYIRSIQSP